MGYSVVDSVERRFVASLWAGRPTDTESADLEDAGKVGWDDLAHYLMANARHLGERFEWMRKVTQGPDAVPDDEDISESAPTPKHRYVIRIQRVRDGEKFQLGHLSFWIVGDEDLKSLTKYGDAYWQFENGRLKYEKMKGTGSFDVVEFWLKGLGLTYDAPIERRILAGILESDSAEVKGVTTWGDIKSWISRTPSYLSRLRYLHELATGESHHRLVCHAP